MTTDLQLQELYETIRRNRPIRALEAAIYVTKADLRDAEMERFPDAALLAYAALDKLEKALKTLLQ